MKNNRAGCPEAAGVSVSYLEVTPLEDPELFQRGMELLPWEERRERIMRYRHGSDRRLGLGAGLLAAHCLRRAGVRDLAVGRTEKNKPYLLNEDLWFNIAHSGTMTVCAVGEAGVDVESLNRKHRRIKCLHPDEDAWLDGQTDEAAGFMRIWTRKESYLKLTGEGLSVRPESFSTAPGSGLSVYFSEWRVEDHLFCLCTRKPCAAGLECINIEEIL